MPKSFIVNTNPTDPESFEKLKSSYYANRRIWLICGTIAATGAMLHFGGPALFTALPTLAIGFASRLRGSNSLTAFNSTGQYQDTEQPIVSSSTQLQLNMNKYEQAQQYQQELTQSLEAYCQTDEWKKIKSEFAKDKNKIELDYGKNSLSFWIKDDFSDGKTHRYLARIPKFTLSLHEENGHMILGINRNTPSEKDDLFWKDAQKHVINIHYNLLVVKVFFDMNHVITVNAESYPKEDLVVYAFGLTLWAIWQKTPSFTEFETVWKMIKSVVKKQGRPSFEPCTSPSFAGLMSQCWRQRVKDCPNMDQVCTSTKLTTEIRLLNQI